MEKKRDWLPVGCREQAEARVVERRQVRFILNEVYSTDASMADHRRQKNI